MTSQQPGVRRLTGNDVGDWRQIRQAALECAPHAFGRTLLSHLRQRNDEHLTRLTESTVYGAFNGDQIVGSAGWHAIDYATEKHRGVINSVFVRPDWQGRGVADDLMNAILDNAKNKVVQLELDVGVNNTRSLAFYTRRGFKIVGTIPRALCHDGVYIDEHRMILRLDA